MRGRVAEQLAADEAGNASDQPLFGCFCQLIAQGCVGSVHGGLEMQIGFGSEEVLIPEGPKDVDFRMLTFDDKKISTIA